MNTLSDEDWLSTAVGHTQLAISKLESGERPYTWENRFRVEGALDYLSERKGKAAFDLADALVADRPFALTGQRPSFRSPDPTPEELHQRLERIRCAIKAEA